MGDIFKVVLSRDAKAQAIGSVVKLPSSLSSSAAGIALGMFDAGTLLKARQRIEVGCRSYQRNHRGYRRLCDRDGRFK